MKDERNGRLVLEQARFSWTFSAQCCLCFFPLASLTESYLFWYCLKDLFTLYRLADKFVLDRQDG